MNTIPFSPQNLSLHYQKQSAHWAVDETAQMGSMLIRQLTELQLMTSSHKWHEMGNERTHVYLSCMGHGTHFFTMTWLTITTGITYPLSLLFLHILLLSSNQIISINIYFIFQNENIPTFQINYFWANWLIPLDFYISSHLPTWHNSTMFSLAWQDGHRRNSTRHFICSFMEPDATWHNSIRVVDGTIAQEFPYFLS